MSAAKGSGQPRTNVGMTKARLELIDEVSAMLAMAYGGRAPGRPETIERVCKMIRTELRAVLAQKERRSTAQ